MSDGFGVATSPRVIRVRSTSETPLILAVEARPANVPEKEAVRSSVCAVEAFGVIESLYADHLPYVLNADVLSQSTHGFDRI